MNDPIPGKAGPLSKTIAQMVLVPRAGDTDVAAKKAKKGQQAGYQTCLQNPGEGRWWFHCVRRCGEKGEEKCRQVDLRRGKG